MLNINDSGADWRVWGEGTGWHWGRSTNRTVEDPPCLNGRIVEIHLIAHYTVILRADTTPPSVDFATSYGPASCGSVVQFTDQSKGAPTAWRWEFGDGKTSADRHPQHAYEKPGEYVVTLSVDGPKGKDRRTKVWDVVLR